MDRASNSQLELFGSINASGEQRKSNSRINFFNFLHGQEKVMLFAIAFVIVGIVSFSFGVERGKRMMLLKLQGAPLQEAPKQAVLSPALGGSSDILVTKKVGVSQVIAQVSTGRFTVQLASYKSRVSAEKDVALLKKKGFSPVLLTKKNYTVLCVGNFNRKEEAVSFFMTQIRRQTRFQDYQIRRLV